MRCTQRHQKSQRCNKMPLRESLLSTAESTIEILKAKTLSNPYGWLCGLSSMQYVNKEQWFRKHCDEHPDDRDQYMQELEDFCTAHEVENAPDNFSFEQFFCEYLDTFAGRYDVQTKAYYEVSDSSKIVVSAQIMTDCFRAVVLGIKKKRRQVSIQDVHSPESEDATPEIAPAEEEEAAPAPTTTETEEAAAPTPTEAEEAAPTPTTEAEEAAPAPTTTEADESAPTSTEPEAEPNV